MSAGSTAERESTTRCMRGQDLVQKKRGKLLGFYHPSSPGIGLHCVMPEGPRPPPVLLPLPSKRTQIPVRCLLTLRPWPDTCQVGNPGPLWVTYRRLGPFTGAGATYDIHKNCAPQQVDTLHPDVPQREASSSASSPPTQSPLPGSPQRDFSGQVGTHTPAPAPGRGAWERNGTRVP